jgi:uncharacterized protein (TIGR03066 family)
MRAILAVGLALVLACGSAGDEKEPEKQPEKMPEKFPFPLPFPEKEPEKRKKKEDDKKEDAIDQRKLPGKWELTKPTVVAKITAEFLADENMSLTSTFAGVDETVTGSYKFVGNNKLIQALRGPEGEDRKTYTVTKLTDDALEYELDGVPFAFKRVKKDKDKK